MNTRAKFYVFSKTVFSGSEYVQVVLQPVTSGSSENDNFFKWTPSGKLEMNLKTEVAELFEVGKSYYLDFSPATVQAAEPA